VKSLLSLSDLLSLLTENHQRRLLRQQSCLIMTQRLIPVSLNETCDTKKLVFPGI
jgi:hypothetical protein